MTVVSLAARAAAAGVRMNLPNASFDGARIVIFDAEPSMSASPGTPIMAAVRFDKDEVAPRRSVRDVVEFPVEFWVGF